LTLTVSGNGSSLGAINGYSRGQVLVKIPVGWRVLVHCTNRAPVVNQSCAITGSSLATRPAFPGSATPDPIKGIEPGKSASFSFVASRPGAFRIASLVDNEEVGNGTWDALQVGGTRRPAVALRFKSPG
jgi:hypothetical protein